MEIVLNLFCRLALLILFTQCCKVAFIKWDASCFYQTCYLIDSFIHACKYAMRITYAAVRRCSYKRVFWKYTANLRENTHAGVSALYIFRITVPLFFKFASLYFHLFCFFCGGYSCRQGLVLGCRARLGGGEGLNICFCVIFGGHCRGLICGWGAGRWALTPPILRFFKYFLFSKILATHVASRVNILYSRYPVLLYLWRIKPILNLWKVSEYYILDCK